jgi:hypothetical protein
MQTNTLAAQRRRQQQKMGQAAFGPDDFDCMGYPLDKNGNKRQQVEEPKHWAAARTTFEIQGVVANGNNDHDRLFGEKYDQVSMRLFGDKSQMWWDRRSPEQVQEFLRQYWDDPELILVQIQKMYNVSNGFPVWNFSYRLSKL